MRLYKSKQHVAPRQAVLRHLVSLCRTYTSLYLPEPDGTGVADFARQLTLATGSTPFSCFYLHESWKTVFNIGSWSLGWLTICLGVKYYAKRRWKAYFMNAFLDVRRK